MSDNSVPTRTPAESGYLPWTLHRLSALGLLGLLAVHVGVQLYPGTGLSVLRTWGVYGGLLDVTLALVLLHGALGVRATVRETSLGDRWTAVVTYGVGVAFLLVFAYRLFG